ncbi:MAG: hypothetical protein POELPBGB_00900 [Bacteroidia bacterium]|nr:hypothetical protein [Bacteroidia bacterium]
MIVVLLEVYTLNVLRVLLYIRNDLRKSYVASLGTETITVRVTGHLPEPKLSP